MSLLIVPLLYPDLVELLNFSAPISEYLPFADEPLAIRKRYGVTRKYPFRPSGHDKPVAFSWKVLRNRRSRKKWSDDENGISAIQRRCRAGSRHRCVDERALRCIGSHRTSVV